MALNDPVKSILSTSEEEEKQQILQEEKRTPLSLLPKQDTEEEGPRFKPAAAIAEKAIRKTERRKTVLEESRRMEEEGVFKEFEGPTARDVVNFLVGDDAAVVGFEWDRDGVSWSLENAKETWAEEPLWMNAMRSASLALNFVPGAAAINKSMQVGKLGKAARKGFKYVADDPTDAEQTFRWFQKFKDEGDEINFLREKGYLDEAAVDISSKTLGRARQEVMAQQKVVQRNKIAEAIAKGEDSYHWGGDEIVISQKDRITNGFNKRFSNSYWKMSNLRADNPASLGVIKGFHQSLDNFMEVERLGRHFSDVPDALTTGEFDTAIMRHWLDPDNHAIDTIPAEARAWVTDVADSMAAHQEEALALGLITQETAEKIPRHVPFLNAMKTAGAKAPKNKVSVMRVGDEATVQFHEYPDLFSPTQLQRQTELPEMLQRLDDMDAGILSGAEEVITNPMELTLRGLVTDRMLLHNVKFMRDYVGRFGKTLDDLNIAAAGDPKRLAKMRKEWVSLDNLPAGKEVLKRTIQKTHPELIRGEAMPYLPKNIMDEWFGPQGMFHQAQTATGLLQGMVALHKTMKTALNPPTQIQNVLGNMVFQSLGGMSPLDPTHLGMQSQLARSLTKVLSAQKAGRAAGVADVLQDGASLKKLGLDKVKVKNDAGKMVEFDLGEVLNDALVRDLTEFNSFTEVEGLNQLSKIYDRMSKEGLSAKAINAMIKFTETPGIYGVLDKASQYYLMGDMVPKLGMFLKYRADGLSKMAAASAVARAMPMYGAVGKGIQTARSSGFLPWATFPAEAARIFKNQMFDNPMRMLPWMNVADISQAGLYMAGGIESYEAAQEAKKSLPMWAVSPQTVVGQGQQLQAAMGGFSGAAVGGLTAGLAGAHPLLGAAVGGAAGMAVGARFGEDKVRGAVLNFMPFSSVSGPQKTSEAWWENMDVQKAMELSPLGQPLAIMEPLLFTMTGKTAYGEEIGAADFTDQVGKVTAGLVGFMAPPMVQKYGYKITTPEPTGAAKAALAAGGAVAGAALGARAGGLGAAIGGAITGGVLGAVANPSRVPQDLGQTFNPRTMQKSDPFADFLINNFGAVKSYAATPEQRASNEKTVAKEYQQIRTHLKKLAENHAINGDEKETAKYLSMIQGTYTRQYEGDPRTAARKFSEFSEKFVDKAGTSPVFKGMSKEDIKRKIRQNRGITEEVRSRAVNEWLEALKSARRM